MLIRGRSRVKVISEERGALRAITTQCLKEERVTIPLGRSAEEEGLLQRELHLTLERLSV